MTAVSYARTIGSTEGFRRTDTPVTVRSSASSCSVVMYAVPERPNAGSR
jgi:hypothetical protein